MSKVMILMGSDSDWKIMKKAAEQLKKFGIEHEVRITSAHRTPAQTIEIVQNFSGDVFIVGAGAAAHLAGVVAAHTVKPVIGVPINATALNGVDALYATVQMPSGIPVATVAIDGTTNAAILAAQILAIKDDVLKSKLEAYKTAMVDEVKRKNDAIQAELV